jgi:hypothetical protein
VIQVPKQLQTVTLYGEIYYPKEVRFDRKYKFKDYIDQSGGFTASALKRRAYIVYPNGEVSSTKKILFFNSYPRVKTGAEIFVPAKKEKAPVTAAEWLGITTGFAALLGIIITIINVTK